LLVLAIVANVAGIWLQQEMLQSLVSNTLKSSPLPPLAADVFGGFVTAARVMAVLVTVGACLMLVWIIRRLMSPSVRQEFA
jgi:small-conductance mechanosensitive channel